VDRNRTGIPAALAAFFLWGILPAYWKQLDFLPAAEIVAQRTLWSLVVLLGIAAWRGGFQEILGILARPSAMKWLLPAGLLLAANWTLYVWATLHDRIIESALGYYLNPFFNMLIGVIWFGERLNRSQTIAVGFALAGVALQIPAIGKIPWVALGLAVSFSLYAVTKKRSTVGSNAGLTVETLFLAPIALVWLLVKTDSPAEAFGGTPAHAALVIGTGLATTLPLVFFSFAARNIRLTTLGMLQFVAPTLQLLIGWKFFGEPMNTSRLLSFALIWLAIIVFAAGSATSRRDRPA
jgi:chloramphenicol-sensitive protein RarD